MAKRAGKLADWVAAAEREADDYLRRYPGATAQQVENHVTGKLRGAVPVGVWIQLAALMVKIVAKMVEKRRDGK